MIDKIKAKLAEDLAIAKKAREDEFEVVCIQWAGRPVEPMNIGPSTPGLVYAKHARNVFDSRVKGLKASIEALEALAERGPNSGPGKEMTYRAQKALATIACELGVADAPRENE